MRQGGQNDNCVGKVPTIEVPVADEYEAYDNMPKVFRDILKDLPLELSAHNLAPQIKFLPVPMVDRVLKQTAQQFYKELVQEFYY